MLCFYAKLHGSSPTCTFGLKYSNFLAITLPTKSLTQAKETTRDLTDSECYELHITIIPQYYSLI